MGLTILPESTQGRLGREMGLAFSQGAAMNLPDPQLQQEEREKQQRAQQFREFMSSPEYENLPAIEASLTPF